MLTRFFNSDKLIFCFKFSFLVLIIPLISACGGGSDSSVSSEDSSSLDLSNVPSSISGFAQKGPYRSLATVIATRIDSDGNLTDDTVSSETLQDGEYNLDLPWSDPTNIVVSGVYLDEITMATSSKPMTLSVVYSPLDTTKANINLFTHLDSGRILNLMRLGSAYKEAKTQALAEIREQFNFDTRLTVSPYQLNLIDGRSGAASDNANLLLFSLAYLSADLDATTTTRNQSDLDMLREDFADNGLIDGSAATAVIDACELAGASIYCGLWVTSDNTQYLKITQDNSVALVLLFKEGRCNDYFLDINGNTMTGDGISVLSLNDNVLSEENAKNGQEQYTRVTSVTGDCATVGATITDKSVGSSTGSAEIFNKIAENARVLLVPAQLFPVPLFTLVRDSLVKEGYVNTPTINDLSTLIQNQNKIVSASLHVIPGSVDVIKMIVPSSDLLPAWVSQKEISLYGEKDAQGLVQIIDSIKISDGSELTNVKIKPDGSIQIAGLNGDKYDVSVVSEGIADVTVQTADGYLSTVRVDNLLPQQVTSAIGASKISSSNPLSLESSDYKSLQLNMATSLSDETSVLAALRQPFTAVVNVTKCDQPYDDARVRLTLSDAFDIGNGGTFLPKLTSPGSGRFETILPIDNRDGGPVFNQVCDRAAEILSPYCTVLNGVPGGVGGLAAFMLALEGGCVTLAAGSVIAAAPTLASCTAAVAAAVLTCTALTKQNCAFVADNAFAPLRTSSNLVSAIVEDNANLGIEGIQRDSKSISPTDTALPNFNISLGNVRSIESFEVSSSTNPPFGIEYDVTANLACVPQGTPVNMNFTGPNNRKFSVASTVSSSGQATFTIPAAPSNGVRDLIQIHVDDSDPNTTLIKTLSIFNPPLVNNSTETLVVGSTTITANLKAEGAESYQIKIQPSFGIVNLDTLTGAYSYTVSFNSTLITSDNFTFTAFNEAGESVEAEVNIILQSSSGNGSGNGGLEPTSCIVERQSICLGEFNYIYNPDTSVLKVTCFELGDSCGRHSGGVASDGSCNGDFDGALIAKPDLTKSECVSFLFK